jgi:hypothetical protein
MLFSIDEKSCIVAMPFFRKVQLWKLTRKLDFLVIFG